jgi:hypothetical protein
MQRDCTASAERRRGEVGMRIETTTLSVKSGDRWIAGASASKFAVWSPAGKGLTSMTKSGKMERLANWRNRKTPNEISQRAEIFTGGNSKRQSVKGKNARWDVRIPDKRQETIVETQLTD